MKGEFVGLKSPQSILHDYNDYNDADTSGGGGTPKTRVRSNSTDRSELRQDDGEWEKKVERRKPSAEVLLTIHRVYGQLPTPLILTLASTAPSSCSTS